MKTRTRMRAAAIDRRPTMLFVWLSLVMLLLLVTLVLRDATIRAQRAMAPVLIDTSDHAVASVHDEVVIVPQLLVSVVPAPEAVRKQAAEGLGATSGLIGLGAHAVRAILGAPDFLRRDGHSQMWRYGSGACTLTVFLHGQDESLAVQHVESRALRNPGDLGADCAGPLAGQRRRADLPG